MKCNDCKERPKYKYWVTVQVPSGEPDATGHVDLTDDSNWQTHARIKVNFVTKGGREGRVFDQVQAEVTMIAKTPSTTTSRAIHPEMRVLFNGRKFNITSAYDIDEMREEVLLGLTEVK